MTIMAYIRKAIRIIAVVSIALNTLSCGSDSDKTSSKEYSVTLKVTGSSPVYITYRAGDEKQELRDQLTPWKKTFTLKSGQYAILGSLWGGESYLEYGYVQVTIDVIGHSYLHDTGSGYGTASAGSIATGVLP